MNPGSSIDPEFADGASNSAGLSRKEFLRLMGASLALAGAGGCTRQRPEKIIPYVRQPEGLTPGEAQWYATAMELGANSYGLLVKSHEGRPTKIEGNPGHPMSLGRTGVHAQAALLDLYDPDRSRVVRHRGKPSTWEDFLAALQRERAKWDAEGGDGVALLTGRTNSPLLQKQIADFQKRYPSARHYQHDAAFPIQVPRERSNLLEPELIVSFDADFLGIANGSPHETAQFAERRRRRSDHPLLYVLESMPSLTGAMADCRFPVNPGELGTLAFSIAAMLTPAGERTEPLPKLPPRLQEMLDRLVGALKSAGENSLVLVGEYQSHWVRGAVAQINELLHSKFVAPAPVSYKAADDLGWLVDDIKKKNVSSLIVFGCNPAYTVPSSSEFPRLPDGAFMVHAGSYFDETAAMSDWHIPLSHFLETWSDTTAADGTYSIVQPLVEPLYPSKSQHEFMSALLSESKGAYEQLRETWGESEANWRKAMHDGHCSAAPPKLPLEDRGPASEDTINGKGPLTVLIRPDPHLLDGRFANNSWLQELPKPITRLTWGNAIHLSPQTAADLHVEHGDEVELNSGNATLRGPVWVLSGHADHCATIYLGGGRTHAGRIGNGIGYKASVLQSFDERWECRVEFRRTGSKQVFATTQHQPDMAGRDPVRVVKRDAALARYDEKPPSLYPEVKYTSPSWGMVIDLDTCTGCGTCTIACQAENNIPVVGRAEVLKGRAMHWIRVDQYIEGDEQPRFLHQPVPCMHCENAPCEVVCPVAATVHDHQGLNVMVYNRCVGTRYCSNNCPYKVRRFNFFQYSDLKSPQLKLQRNPDVTVRERGVMEKCTYCVQRITAARITADVENRAIRDGEVIPACAQACPASAIVFGDILDPVSKVSTARRDPRHYALLEELNTRPRTTYLAKMVSKEEVPK